MAKNPLKLDQLEKEYSTLASIADSFSKEITRQLEILLERKKIPLLFSIQDRVKSWSSIIDKLERKKLTLKKITELQDFIGLRMVLLFKKDLNPVINLIEENFEVYKKYDTAHRLKEDQFGYSSIHLLAKVPEKWLNVPSMSKFKDFNAEIQLRTGSQHIWAEASHALQYKIEKDVPRSLLRAVFRVSALLETVDLEFERVLSQREEYRNSIVTTPDEQELNVDILEKFLDSILPPENKDVIERYDELLAELSELEIRNTKELGRMITEYLPGAMKVEKTYYEKAKQELYEMGSSESTTPKRSKAGVFYTHSGLTREIMLQKFGKKYNEMRKKFPRLSEAI